MGKKAMRVTSTQITWAAIEAARGKLADDIVDIHHHDYVIEELKCGNIAADVETSGIVVWKRPSDGGYVMGDVKIVTFETGIVSLSTLFESALLSRHHVDKHVIAQFPCDRCRTAATYRNAWDFNRRAKFASSSSSISSAKSNQQPRTERKSAPSKTVPFGRHLVILVCEPEGWDESYRRLVSTEILRKMGPGSVEIVQFSYVNEILPLIHNGTPVKQSEEEDEDEVEAEEGAEEFEDDEDEEEEEEEEEVEDDCAMEGEESVSSDATESSKSEDDDHDERCLSRQSYSSNNEREESEESESGEDELKC